MVLQYDNQLPLNGQILKPVPDNLLRNHLDNSVFILPGHKIGNMLNLIIVGVVFLDRKFDPFLNVVRVSVQVWDVLDVSNRFGNAHGFLFVHDFLDEGGGAAVGWALGGDGCTGGSGERAVLLREVSRIGVGLRIVISSLILVNENKFISDLITSANKNAAVIICIIFDL